jgi:hypothetical protein
VINSIGKEGLFIGTLFEPNDKGDKNAIPVPTTTHTEKDLRKLIDSIGTLGTYARHKNTNTFTVIAGESTAGFVDSMG